MIVPNALLADDGKIEFLVKNGNGDVEAVNFFRCSVLICNGIRGGLKELCSLLLGILGKAGIQIKDALGNKAYVDRHLAVFNGKDSLVLGLHS